MISILITYYNQQNYISRSLESVLKQNLSEPFEILIGDDGSTDDTVKIIKTYIEKNSSVIKLFIQERDTEKKYNSVERASFNRLNLLKQAKGDYVCFLDGDDSFCDFNFIQNSINILKNTKNIGVAHKYQELYPNNTSSEPKGIQNKKSISLKHYAKNYYTHVGTIVFRNIFNLKDYNKLISLKSFDDNDITFYFLKYGKLCCDNTVTYSYYQNEGSIWNTANNFEKCLINAIDYEIIYKIINKYNSRLLIKYGSALMYVFKNLDELNNQKYEKYKTQTVKNGFLYKLMNYNNLTLFNKKLVNCKILKFKINYFIASKYYRLLDKFLYSLELTRRKPT